MVDVAVRGQWGLNTGVEGLAQTLTDLGFKNKYFGVWKGF